MSGHRSREPHSSTVCPTYSPSAQPGGMTNTAEPIGVVHWFSRSRSDRRCWIGRNCLSRSAWNDTKICPASETASEPAGRSEEHTAELQSRGHLVCRLLLE